jgi:CRP/FNR family transcriptional regulator, cyclic AMP receptor protein
MKSEQENAMKYINILKQTEIFYGLTPTQLELVASVCQEKSFASGETILPEGGSSDELYVIIQGEAEVLINPGLVSDDNGERSLVVVATLRRGQSFGEIALVDRGLRSATVRASQNNTRLLMLPRDQLMVMCDDYPQLGYRLMSNLAVDLALKLRLIDLRTREGWLYRPREKTV